MRGCVEVAQPLWKGKSAHEQRILRAQDLHHPTRPANPWPNGRRGALGAKPRALWNFDEGIFPTPFLHARPRVGVFISGLSRDAADLIQSLPPEPRPRAAKEARVPQIVAILHET